MHTLKLTNRELYNVKTALYLLKHHNPKAFDKEIQPIIDKVLDCYEGAGLVISSDKIGTLLNKDNTPRQKGMEKLMRGKK